MLIDAPVIRNEGWQFAHAFDTNQQTGSWTILGVMLFQGVKGVMVSATAQDSTAEQAKVNRKAATLANEYLLKFVKVMFYCYHV